MYECIQSNGFQKFHTEWKDFFIVFVQGLRCVLVGVCRLSHCIIHRSVTELTVLSGTCRMDLCVFSVKNAGFNLVLIVLISIHTRCSDERKPTLTNNQKDDIRKMITALMACTEIQGITLAVVNKDEIIMKDGFGFADVKENKPVTPETLFPIASTSKGFTATLLTMLLHETQDEEGSNK